jgi:hypothetical protein
MVELTRGWNSRLGFSLQGDGRHTYISAIYADSVAAKDGRLQAGDQVLMVTDCTLFTVNSYKCHCFIINITVRRNRNH